MSYPQQPPGAYPGQYQPPQQPPRRNVLRGCLIAAAALLGVFIIIGVIGAALGGGKSTPAASGTTAAAPAASTSAAAPAAHPAAPRAHVIAVFTGSGIENTARFTTPSDWTLKWSYNCASIGFSGNFIVGEDSFGSVNVNELGMHGHGTTHGYSDAGRHYLSVNSECHWKLKVIG
jgi:hypothetical protein